MRVPLTVSHLLVAVVLSACTAHEPVGGAAPDAPKPDSAPATSAIERYPIFNDEDVVNGNASLRGAIEISPGTTVVVPVEATVLEDGIDGRAEVLVFMTLGFFGHPPDPLTIDSALKNMGLAIKTDGTRTLLSTFGEWANLEGSAKIKLAVRVAKGAALVRETGLRGPWGQAAAWPRPLEPAAKEGVVGHWYGPVRPIPGWTRVELQLDERREARRLFSNEAAQP